MRARLTTLTVLLAFPTLVCSAQQRTHSTDSTVVSALLDTLTMNTWSVVGVDPKTGDVGVAMASCVANTLADALASLVPGKGAAATQAGFDVGNRNRVFEALKSGANAAEVIKRAADSTVEAGSMAGGDVRCNNDSTRQTAATAMILVARGTDAPYAAEKIGMSDQGTSNAPWLAISTTVPKGGDNPLLELRRRYDAWRRSGKR
jgi:uncharacterized Ntn-hydrolase superfamily protein